MTLTSEIRAHVGVTDRDDRLHVRQQADVARGAVRRARCRASTTTPRPARQAVSVASTIVRPFAERAAQDQPARQVHVGLLARHVDGGGGAAGMRHRQDERRRAPAVNASGAPTSSVAENGPGPADQRDVRARLRRRSAADGFPCRASSSVASLISVTLATPARSTSPSTRIVARAVAPSTRTRMSARVSAAARARSPDPPDVGWRDRAGDRIPSRVIVTVPGSPGGALVCASADGHASANAAEATARGADISGLQSCDTGCPATAPASPASAPRRETPTDRSRETRSRSG